MKKKPAKRKPKSVKRISNMIGECVTWNGNVYTVMTFETMQDRRFEKVELTAVRHLPIS